jgi:hypothetical protein
LDLKRKVLFQIFNNHDQERQLDAQSSLLLGWTSNVIGRDIGANDFQDGGLDVVVGDSLDVAVANFFIPDLKRF